MAAGSTRTASTSKAPPHGRWSATPSAWPKTANWKSIRAGSYRRKQESGPARIPSHLHPVAIKKQGIALSCTWCMGGVTFFLFLVETVTGVLLMFYYRPTLEHAYEDMMNLRSVVSLGILREIHRWAAHAMVITVWLHMYRV